MARLYETPETAKIGAEYAASYFERLGSPEYTYKIERAPLFTKEMLSIGIYSASGHFLCFW